MVTKGLETYIEALKKVRERVKWLDGEEKLLLGMSGKDKGLFTQSLVTKYGTELTLDFDQSLELVRENRTAADEELRRLETIGRKVQDVLGKEFCGEL